MSHIEGFDAADFSTRIAGEIKDFSGDGYIDKKSERRLDAVLKYAIVAGKKVSSPCCHCRTLDGRLKPRLLVAAAISHCKTISRVFIHHCTTP